MRIGLLCHGTLGGSTVVAVELAGHLVARGHDVHLVAGRRPHRVAPGVVVHEESPALAAPAPLAAAAQLAALDRVHPFDVVHAHYAVPHTYAAVLARALGASGFPVVTTVHGTDVTHLGADPVHRPLVVHALAASNAVTAPSRALAAAAATLHPAPVQVVPNFVDPDVFRPADAPRPAPTVVHVSNFRPVKRVSAVIDVFARVARGRDVHLHLVGDGPERAAAQARVAALGLADRVRFVGAVARGEREVRGCSVFLLPSASESFGLAALEALASGVPVVASAVGGLPEVVRDGETGFLAPADDLDAFAERVAALVDDDTLRARMAAAARRDACARFGPEAAVSAYETLYAELALSSRASARR